MILTIDGLDVVPFIEENGITWTLNGVDGPEAGRNLDISMDRDLLGYKANGEVSCVWMTKEQAYALYNKIRPEFFTVVTDTIPWIDGTVTLTMYSNNASSTLLEEYTDGTKQYGDLKFPLIER